MSGSDGLPKKKLSPGKCVHSTRPPRWFCLVEMSLRFSVVLHHIHCQFVAQVMVMVAAAGLSFIASVFISVYSCLTFTYGEEDEDVFHHHSSAKVVTITKHTNAEPDPNPDP